MICLILLFQYCTKLNNKLWGPIRRHTLARGFVNYLLATQIKAAQIVAPLLIKHWCSNTVIMVKQCCSRLLEQENNIDRKSLSAVVTAKHYWITNISNALDLCHNLLPNGLKLEKWTLHGDFTTILYNEDYADTTLLITLQIHRTGLLTFWWRTRCSHLYEQTTSNSYTHMFQIRDGSQVNDPTTTLTWPDGYLTRRLPDPQHGNEI